MHIDFCGPLPSGEYLLVLIDRFSRYPEVEIVRSTKAACVIPKLDKIFTVHGIPYKIVSDNGPQFNGDEFEGEGEVAFFSAKRWDRRNRADLIESATPCHGVHMVGPYRDSNPLRLTILAAISEDYTTTPQHLQCIFDRYMKALGIEHDPVTPHWPQATGEVELFNQPLEKMLQAAEVEGKI